jgi:hypothetical protein
MRVVFRGVAYAGQAGICGSSVHSQESLESPSRMT